MNAKLDRLLARELDGELTDVERLELDRGAYTAPEIRRERETWSSIGEALRERPAPKLNAAKMASRVAKQLPERRRAAVPRRLAFAAAAALAFVALTRATPSPSPVPATAPIAKVTVDTNGAPVVIQVDDKSFADDPEPVPVEIRF